jgi:predicted Zn-ribbon and HTH transcriptional regulator
MQKMQFEDQTCGVCGMSGVEVKPMVLVCEKCGFKSDVAEFRVRDAGWKGYKHQCPKCGSAHLKNPDFVPCEIKRRVKK